MGKPKLHHFRDDLKILDELPDGEKSEFIRESLRLRIKMDKKTFEPEQITDEKLKDFYNNQQDICEEIMDMYDYGKRYANHIKRKCNKELKNVIKEEMIK